MAEVCALANATKIIKQKLKDLYISFYLMFFLISKTFEKNVTKQKNFHQKTFAENLIYNFVRNKMKMKTLRNAVIGFCRINFND